MMKGYLIAEEGPLAGETLTLEEDALIGRDKEVCSLVLDDPMVSREHARISLNEEGVLIESLSEVNPVEVNGTPISTPTLLKERDTVLLGETLFSFSTKEEEEEDLDPLEDTEEDFSFNSDITSRWILKVISGPNAGAEFPLTSGKTLTIGKDISEADIAFQDLSVSKKHALLTLEENGQVTIEDGESLNGTFVNGEKIEGKTVLKSQDLIAMGTTSCLVIDREQSRDTIFSATLDEEEEEPPLETITAKNWKNLAIPRKHLIIGIASCCLILFAFVGLSNLFKTTTITKVSRNETEEISQAMRQFQGVTFSFNQGDGKLFLMGHVLTEIDHQELSYLIKTLPFVKSVDDNVVIDELVSENMNALLSKNSQWKGVYIVANKPGVFSLRGYLNSQEEVGLLTDYLNKNFSYLDRLDNQIVVERTLQAEIQTLLIEGGFMNVAFQIEKGELILTGRVTDKEEIAFHTLISKIKKMKGIQGVKNLVIFTGASNSRIDLTNQYKVTGVSKFDGVNQYVLINGKILSKGDTLEGMLITAITPKEVLLEKEGIKYKIDYNLH